MLGFAHDNAEVLERGAEYIRQCSAIAPLMWLASPLSSVLYPQLKRKSEKTLELLAKEIVKIPRDQVESKKTAKNHQ
jgi:hypothetical protein